MAQPPRKKMGRTPIGSGTGGRCCIFAGQTLRVHSPGSSTFLRETTSWPPSWKCDVKSKIRLHQSMRRLKNNPAEFNPDLNRNVGALGFSEDSRPNKNKNRWLAICDQFLIQKHRRLPLPLKSCTNMIRDFAYKTALSFTLTSKAEFFIKF